MGVTVINSLDEFKEAIKTGPAVFDFHAEWCGPCKTISPKFEELSTSTEGVNFYSVDVDEQSDVAQECNITAMPTFMLFQNGAKVDSLRGALKDKLEALVQKASSLK